MRRRTVPELRISPRQVTHVVFLTKSFALLVREEQGMSCLLRVGVIGDFNPRLRYHLATNEALSHAAHTLSLRVDTTWLPTESMDNADCEATLQRYDALWCAPASPYKSMHGALNAIQWAREKDWPFIGN